MPSYNYDNLQNLYAAYLRSAQQVESQRKQRLADILNGINTGAAQGGLGGNQLGGKKWGSIQEMNADLAKLRAARAPKVIDKPARIREIHKELDIIRGIVPTPKGYKVDTSKVKRLMAELKELEK